MSDVRDAAAARDDGRRQLAPRIESDPEILRGKPVVAGTRMSVEAVLEQLACGDTIDEVLESYPFLTRDDVYAALAYAAHLAGAATAAPEPAAP